jgi:hypothetical protein
VSQDAPPIAEGQLEFCTRPRGGGLPLEHARPPRHVGADRGMLRVVDTETGIEVWLHPDELVLFDTRGGAS